MAGLPETTSAEVVRLAKDCPLLLARELRLGGSVDLSIGTSPTRFAHGLGRRPRNFVASPIGSAAVIFRVDDSAVSPPADPTREIVLQSSLANAVVRVLVY
jgi:hypothetical protein